jgi:hypothetical protein
MAQADLKLKIPPPSASQVHAPCLAVPSFLISKATNLDSVLAFPLHSSSLGQVTLLSRTQESD